MSKDKLKDIRREYGDLGLSREQLPDEPLVLFQSWFEDILKTDNLDPTAMMLATVDEQHQPHTRVVLLKGLSEGDLIFYTNYESSKAQQIEANAKVAANFYWPELARQVRILGRAERITAKESDEYFASRPQGSQLSAVVSAQSRVIESRKSLETAMNALIEKHGQELVMRPQNWGGYRIHPTQYEFWQGRDNRLHDRFRFGLSAAGWDIERLAP